MKPHLCPSGSANGTRPVLYDLLGGNARVERAAGGAYGHLLPAAHSMSIGA